MSTAAAEETQEQETPLADRLAAAASDTGDSTGQPVKEKKGQQTRPYHVLLDTTDDTVEGDSTQQTFRKVGTYTAAGDKQAIKLALAAGDVEIGQKFVAVADSGWHEHEPKLKEVEPKLAW